MELLIIVFEDLKEVVLFGWCGLCFVPLVWSWSLAGLSCWPEPLKEYLATSHHPGPFSRSFGPLAVGLDHYSPPQKPEPYSHPGSTWRRVISNNGKSEPHKHSQELYMFVPVFTSSWVSCSSVLLHPTLSVTSSCPGPEIPRWNQQLATFPSPWSEQMITDWHPLFTKVNHLFRVSSPVLSAVWPAK